jgi:hypothetical protein
VLWAGRPAISFDSLSDVDPWALFKPVTILSGHVQTANFSLPLGKVVKDYLAQ